MTSTLTILTTESYRRIGLSAVTIFWLGNIGKGFVE